MKVPKADKMWVYVSLLNISMTMNTLWQEILILYDGGFLKFATTFAQIVTKSLFNSISPVSNHLDVRSAAIGIVNFINKIGFMLQYWKITIPD